MHVSSVITQRLYVILLFVMVATNLNALDDLDVRWGASLRQGKRDTKEDDFRVTDARERKLQFFSVYDGHAGRGAVKHVTKYLHENILAGDGDLPQAIIDGHKNTDEAFLKEDDGSGTTAVTLVLDEDNQRAYVAWVGDSRIILLENGKIIFASLDHKPTDKNERERIQEAGGFVLYNRINGSLALSRAFGDKIYKKSENSEHKWDKFIVTVRPDIEEIELRPGCHYQALIFSDGVSESIKDNDSIVNCLLKMLKKDLVFRNNNYGKETTREDGNVRLALAATDIRDEAYSQGSTDNITTMIVEFTVPNKAITKEEENDFKISEKVDNYPIKLLDKMLKKFTITNN